MPLPPRRRLGVLEVTYSLWTKPTVAWTHEKVAYDADFIIEARAWALSKGYERIVVVHKKHETKKPEEKSKLPPLKPVPKPRVVSVD